VLSTVRRAVVVFVVGTAVALCAAPAAAHDERPAHVPDGSGHVPAYRTSGRQILVCATGRDDFAARVAGFPYPLRQRNLALFDQCQSGGVRNVQQAVDDATPGTRILILPGVYREEASLTPPVGRCAHLPAPMAAHGYQILSWEQQVSCPHNQNLVAVLAKPGLQIEGTGAEPQDVVLDARYRKLNALRVDRSDGTYLRNFTVQRSTFNGAYIMESDGFVIDHMLGRWTDEYGFLTFADDHGLYTDCEAYGNGEAGVYPGAAANLNERSGFAVTRYAIEIRNCNSHHNLLGYSGTAGDSVWVHDSDFFANGAGISMDSAFPHHPGLPQNHAKLERNRIHDNNTDYYRYVRDGACARPSPERGYEHGVVCPSTGMPIGAGVITAGGNFNVFVDNWVYAQNYAAFVLFWVPGVQRGDGLGELFDTSHHNRYIDNHLGSAPTGARRPNRLDVWWDGQGTDNRWQPALGEPATLPGLGGFGTARILGDPFKLAEILDCSGYRLVPAQIPAGCDWYGARGLSRVDVRAATGEAVLLILAALALLWRYLPHRFAGCLATVLGVLGAALGPIGVANEGTRTGAAAALLLAGWWLLSGWLMRRRGGSPGLAWTATALGVLAALQAVDTGLWMLPLIPVSLAWPILLVGLNWVVWLLLGLRRASATA
jgi:hypothetical protein